MWVLHGERFTRANGRAPGIWVFCYEYTEKTTSVTTYYYRGHQSYSLAAYEYTHRTAKTARLKIFPYF